MIEEFFDRQAADADLYELEDAETGEKKKVAVWKKCRPDLPRRSRWRAAVSKSDCFSFASNDISHPLLSEIII